MTPGRRGGGIALDFSRGKTSKERLEIDWHHPVWKPDESEVEEGRTRAAPVRRALPLEEAFALCNEGDFRPLLVVRECDLCKGSNHALLSRNLDNEQTVLLTHWFRCVKLPTHVLEDDHPLHNLFEPEKEGERIPHLFLADWDGSGVFAMPGDQSQSELWDVMFRVLDRNYDGDARKAVKEMRKLLSQYDTVDAMEKEIKARIDNEIEKRGPRSPKIKRLQNKLAELQQEREELIAREKVIRDLALKAAEAGATGEAR